MLPYVWQRMFRATRLALALSCAGVELANSRLALTEPVLLFAAFSVYALIALVWQGLEDIGYSVLAMGIDTLFFFLILTSGADYSYWVAGAFYTYLLGVAVMVQGWWKALFVSTSAIALVNFLQPVHFGIVLPMLVFMGVLGTALAIEHEFLDDRVSTSSRQSVLYRYDAEKAREAERQRIAADFHDGPLQSFISFQMRLEVIRKVLARDPAVAASEIEQLQHLTKSQVNELRTFVRSMRPADVEGSLNGTLRRVVEQFQKDSGIPATFVSAEFLDPAEPETSLELLQIVREALYNVQKHASATRVAVSAERTHSALELVIEDNGHGFSFSGRYTLDELELLRLGPNSIKRRVRTLGGDLMLDSRPGQGAALRIRLAT